MLSFQFLFALALTSPDALVEQLRRDGASDIRVQRIQLDRDPALEVLVQYVQADSGAFAVVLDEQAGAWREAGRFNTWWDFAKTDAARMIELRPTVDPGIMDLIVRTRGGGTEQSRTTLEIFRVRNGAAVNVLSVKEQETAMEHPSGDVYTISATLEFAPPRITVRTTKNPGKQVTATSYVWDNAKFRFEAETGR